MNSSFKSGFNSGDSTAQRYKSFVKNLHFNVKNILILLLIFRIDSNVIIN